MRRQLKRIILPLLLLVALGGLWGQSTLTLNGLNEASFIYRTAPDSLNAYFRDSFGFNMGYKNFSFGMKFIAELPKYSTDQSELLESLVSDRLSLGWQELYVTYAKDAYLIHAGTIEETFGSGIVFRSYKDLEMDEDYRVNGFKFGYDDKLRVKALYSAFNNTANLGKLDLAYGADAEYPVFKPLTLGASYLAQQTLIGTSYKEDEVLGGRLRFLTGWLEATAEVARRDKKESEDDGTALYGTLSTGFGPILLGGAYKRYDGFDYYNHLQDLPLANHHNETLADSQGSGADEEGFQAWTTVILPADLTLTLDYAEAWNQAGDMKMNDAYAGLDWLSGNLAATVSYSHVEKIDEASSHWQKETYPAVNISFPAGKTAMVVSGEFKTVEKQAFTEKSRHYEPKLQVDLTLGKLGISLGAQSWWKDFGSVMDSRYWPNLELKYPVLAGTDLVFFAGKEAGGKVCRNGVCRYVAPFSGLRLELATRF
jgi:hypothetical protein